MTVTVFGDPASFDIEHFHTALIELIPTSLKDMLKLGDEHDCKFDSVMPKLGGF